MLIFLSSLFLFGAFVLLCLIFVVIWQREIKKLIILTPPLLFCLNEIARVWPSIIYAQYQGVSRDVYVLLLVTICSFAFLAGYIVVRNVQGWDVGSPLSFFDRPLAYGSDREHITAILGCSVLLFALSAYHYRGIPPLFRGIGSAITAGDRDVIRDTVRDGRFELTKSHHFGGEYRWQGVIRATTRIGWTMVTVIALLQYLRQRNRFWLLLSSLLAVACIVFIAGEGTRSPIIWALVYVVVAFSHVIQVRLRHHLMIFAVILVMLFGLSSVYKFSSLANESSFLTAGTIKLFNRIANGDGSNTIWIVEGIRRGETELGYGRIHLDDAISALPGASSRKPYAYRLFVALGGE